MNNLLEISTRTLVGFAVLLFLTRLLGKKQLGQMTIFTYITGIVIGSMAAEIILHKDVELIGIVAMILWCALSIAVEYVGLKNASFRVILNGEPTIIIKKGEIDEHQMKKLRLNMDDLSMLLRINNVFSITDVDFAIFEPNGELSVLKKPEKENVTKQDLNISSPPNSILPCEIIVDGKIVPKNLKEIGKEDSWLINELRQQGVMQVSHVLYAELQNNSKLYIQKKNSQSGS